MTHQHTWVETQRVFAHPPWMTFNIRNASEDMIQQLSFGVTTIVSKCSCCGELRQDRILGDARTR